jgi:hypothetical protein
MRVFPRKYRAPLKSAHLGDLLVQYWIGYGSRVLDEAQVLAVSLHLVPNDPLPPRTPEIRATSLDGPRSGWLGTHGST